MKTHTDAKAEHMEIMNRRIVCLPYVAMDFSQPVPGHLFDEGLVFPSIHANLSSNSRSETKFALSTRPPLSRRSATPYV